MSKTLTQLQLEAKDALENVKQINLAKYVSYKAQLPFISLSKQALQKFIDKCNRV